MKEQIYQHEDEGDFAFFEFDPFQMFDTFFFGGDMRFDSEDDDF